MKLRSVLAAACLVLPLARAQAPPQPGARLVYVAMVSRDGVHAPTETAAQLKELSAEPWPAWGVDPGYLTEHGGALVKLLGAYDRAYFAGAGLLDATGCTQAPRVFIRADNNQRAHETGRALGEGMLPGCAVEVHTKPEGESDPLFDGSAFGTPDRNVALASVLGRIGGDPSELNRLYRPALDTLAGIVGTPRPAWLDAPTVITAGRRDALIDVSGALRTGSNVAENLFLEYVNGMSGPNLGWGRLTAANLRQIMILHTANADLAHRTRYLARAAGSDLLEHVLDSLRQAVAGKAVPGALGNPGDAGLAIVGHEANLSNIAGMLGLGWLLPGYRPDDTPPGGAMIFELWRSEGGRCQVRTYLRAQTLDQMHDSAALTLSSPPARAPIFIPGCSGAGPGYECEWAAFERVVSAAIDPSFVQRRVPAATPSPR